MKETKTTGNYRHADPTTGSPPIELVLSAAAICTADVVQALRQPGGNMPSQTFAKKQLTNHLFGC